MASRFRLILKQHRFEFVAVAVMCLGVAALALFEAWRLNSLGFPAACLENGRPPSWFDPSVAPTACSIASRHFYDIANGPDARLVTQAGTLLPFLSGILVGAPLVAREVEEGTAPLAWSLAGSRSGWLLGRLVVAVAVLVPLLLAAGLAIDVLYGALAPGVDAHASFTDYTDRGVYVAVWGLGVLMVAVALGTLAGRTMPAVLVALVICLFVRAFWEPGLNAIALSQMAAVEVPGTRTPGEMSVSAGPMFLDGKPWYGDVDTWDQANMVCTTTGTATSCTLPEPGLINSWMVIKGDQYWPVVSLGGGLMLLASSAFGVLALLWVERRRPY
jgi:hypothetical protein